MRTFILIGKSRKTGKDELILGREAKGFEHIEAYKKFGTQRVSEDYENVVLVESAPFKRPLKFITKAEADARAEADNKAKEAVSKSTKAEADAKAAKKSPAKKKNAADKTENQTGTDAGTKSE